MCPNVSPSSPRPQDIQNFQVELMQKQPHLCRVRYNPGTALIITILSLLTATGLHYI